MTDSIRPLGGASAPQGPEDKGKAPDSAEFRRLLEKLEQLAGAKAAEPVADADELRDALRRAEDDFRSVMDLRRALEDAYRRKGT